MGEVALKRRRTIMELEKSGVINMNRELEFPYPAQKIAVISSDTAAGYGDFLRQLHDNAAGLVFYTKLFPAVMQGKDAEASILAAIDKIFACEAYFDALVLIRGGGAKTDLHCFDSYDLAFHLAQFPLPVLTGIGHDRDESVADMVAWQSLKTPTAVASFLLEQAMEALNHTEWIGDRVRTLSITRIEQEKNKLQTLAFNTRNCVSGLMSKAGERLNINRYRTKNVVKSIINKNKALLEQVPVLLKRDTGRLILRYSEKLDTINKRKEYLDPRTLFARGYAMASHNGKPVTGVKALKPGDRINLHMADGTAEAVTEKVLPVEKTV